MSTYLALTTINFQQNGYKVVGQGVSKEVVRRQAEDEIIGNQKNQAKDIYTDTELKNLIVVSKSYAKRKFGIDIDSPDCLEQQFYTE